MIPVLAYIKKINDISIWKTTDGKFGIGFEITPCDLECDDRENYHRKLFGLIRNLNPNILGRIKLSVSDESDNSLLTSRTEAISEIGFTKKSVQLYLELESEPELVKKAKTMLFNESSDKDLNALVEVHDFVKRSGLLVKPLPESEIEKLFLNTKLIWQKCSASVCNGYEHIGIVRLLKPSNDSINEESLARIYESLPKPFNVHFSFQKLDAAKIKIELERKLKQTSSDNSINPTNLMLKESTISTISEAAKNGSQFFNYELIFTFERSNEKELFEDLKLSFNVLNSFAEFQIETFGATPNFLATLVGNSQHIPLKEVDEVLPLFMPIWFIGENSTHYPQHRSLMLHRSDFSLFDFDLFNSNYSVFNSLIVGTSGKGKSVLTGMLTQALLNDPNVSVIKLDVGGSHSKECELLGGKEFVFQLNSPSGINPFSIIRNLEISDSEKVGILSRFLIVLIQEQGELQFSKDLRSQVEENIQSYLSMAKSPSLQEFYDLMTKFPRRALLRRWVSGGVYQNAFASDQSEHTGNTRLRYYNFSQVFQASDPEFAQAGLAAVLVQFNVETLINKNKRIVLICDETPFFIKSCFDFFKFSTANVRKFGHAVILITQLSTDLIVNGDTGIIENSPQRFLFSIDGDSADYQNRFALSTNQIHGIKALRSIPKEISEVFLQTGEIGRKLLVKITPKEYWTLTSSKQDREKLEKLRASVPNLGLSEAIQCLSLA